MLRLYDFLESGNGYKVRLLLTQLGIPFERMQVDILNGETRTPQFLALNPNGRIPVLVDQDAPGGPLTIIESGAILMYLAEKTGLLVPSDVRGRSETMQWLMFQMAGIGPMLGQANWFANSAPEKIPYAIQRYVNESARLFGVLDVRLAGREYLAGSYSIADVATYPWVAVAWPIFTAMMPDTVGKLGQLAAWLERVGARPAVQRGMNVPA
jgi:GST-like protein